MSPRESRITFYHAWLRHGQFGIGIYHYDFSDDLRLGIAPLVEIDPETGVEVFNNLAVTPWFRLTADLQWIEPINRNLADRWLGGLRASFAF